MVHQATNEAIQLLTPYTMGRFDLFHWVVLAPMTRCCSYGNVPRPHTAVYYTQRATKGAQDYPETPAPRCSSRLTSGSPSSMSSTARERSSSASYDFQPNGQAPISSTDRQITPDRESDIVYSKPRWLPADEIPQIVDNFRLAAWNAIEAGFDGVEIHGANGYLLEQFMKDSANDRTDQYGGSLENRCRFAVEVVDAVVHEVGTHRVGIRLSPFLDYMDYIDFDPTALGTYMVQQLNKHEGFQYCHMVEPRMAIVDGRRQIIHELLPFRKAFNGTFIAAGGYDREEGSKMVADGYTDLVAYARLFLANPDLPKRFELDAPLNKYDRSTFYTQDPMIGYTDYPFLDDDHGDSADAPHV